MVVRDLDTGISFSPDGKRFVFARANNPEVGKYQMFTANADGSDAKSFMTGGDASKLPLNLVWSPNGAQIAGVELQSGGQLSSIMLFDLASGKPELAASFKDKVLRKQLWLPSGKGLVGIYQDRPQISLGIKSDLRPSRAGNFKRSRKIRIAM